MNANKPELLARSRKMLPVSLAIAAFILAAPAPATWAWPDPPPAATAADDPDALMKQAEGMEKQGNYSGARGLYSQAYESYKAHRKIKETVKAYLKMRSLDKKKDKITNTAPDAPTGGGANNGGQGRAAVPPTADTAPAAQKATVPMTDETPAPDAVAVAPGPAPLPLDKSAMVHPNKKGAMSVSAANGKPIVGIKLSRHDSDIHNPSIVVTPDGTIHVAFVEKMAQSPYSYSVYHRSSSDGGKTWTAAKNLSEVLPDYEVGNAQIAADGAGRIYVIWRTGFGPGIPISGTDPHAAQVVNNLVYRVLDNGAWNGKAILVHPTVTREQQDIGSASWFASTDPSGKVHVLWNALPDQRHPEAITGGSHSPRIGASEILESDLDGTTASPLREVFLAPIDTVVNNDNTQGWPSSDYFDTINGYVDSAGRAHILAHVHHPGSSSDPTVRYALIEGGKMTQVFDLPGSPGDYWRYAPRLLVDAQGQRHAIAMYPRGEQPHIRDYVIGSDAEPTVIRAAKEVNGKLEGFQAYQGPGGSMIVVMQMNDTGKDTDDELYVSTSNGGGKWSTPVNVTNNTGHIAFHSTQTSSQSHVATESYWYPGPAAAAFDKSGHLVMAYVNKEFGIVDSSAFGVSIAGGSTATPKLLFLRF